MSIKESKVRDFKEGELVLLYDGSRCKPFQDKDRGAYLVLRWLGPVNYLLSTPGRRQSTRSVHVNQLKKYEGEVAAAAAVGDDGRRCLTRLSLRREGWTTSLMTSVSPMPRPWMG